MKRGGGALPSPPLAAADAVAVAVARRAADKASHDEDDNDGVVPALAVREAIVEAAVDVASAQHQRWTWRKGAATAVTLFRTCAVVVNIFTCGDAIKPPRGCGAARRDAARRSIPHTLMQYSSS